MIHVEAETCEEALFALEEGLRCRELAFVIGEITGNPRAMTFTASRRLSLASERYGVPLWLVRLNARPDLSSARMRWDTRSEPSAPAEWDRLAPGFPIWRAELFRSRSHAPGIWRLQQMGGQLSVLAPPNSQAYGANRMVGQAFVRKISPEMRNAKLLHDAEGIQLQAIA
jgi:protein ImuA